MRDQDRDDRVGLCWEAKMIYSSLLYNTERVVKSGTPEVFHSVESQYVSPFRRGVGRVMQNPLPVPVVSVDCSNQLA